MNQRPIDIETVLFVYDSYPLDEFIKDLNKRKNQAKKDGYIDLKIRLCEKWGYYDDVTVSVVISGVKKMCVCGKPVEIGTTACKEHNVKI